VIDNVQCLVHQVSPDLYGDNNTRLFTYWTVSLTSSVAQAYIDDFCAPLETFSHRTHKFVVCSIDFAIGSFVE
jgi:hypothetical protein